MIALFQGNELRLLGLSFGFPIGADQTNHRFVRLRAARGQDHPAQALGRDLGQLGRQLHGRDRGRADQRGCKGQLVHLLGHGAVDFFAAVSDMHIPQGGETVDILLAFRIPEIDALTLDKNGYSLVLLQAERHKPVDEVGRILLAQGFCLLWG